MNIDKTCLREITKKYGLDALATEMETRLDIPSVKLGLIGAFSSGKTSLLNALFGTQRLPVDIKPTTKAICIVEPTTGLEKPCYFRETEGGREEVDIMTFTAIVNGDALGDAAIQLPTTDKAFEGMVFVDTPGINSLGRDEAERTYSYLNLMDAAIVCIPVTDGTLRQPVIDFICSPRLRHMAGRLAFVITQCDRKSPDEVADVRATVTGLLEDLSKKGSLPLRDVANHVIAVSRDTAPRELMPFLSLHFFSHRAELRAERERKELKVIAGEIAHVLRKQANTRSFDTTQFNKAIEDARREREAIDRELAQRNEILAGLDGQLRSLVSNTMFAHQMDVTQAEQGNDLHDALVRMHTDIVDGISRFCQQHSASFVPSPAIVGQLDASLNQAMQSIERRRNIAVNVGTGVLTAVICPAAGVAGNAGEALGGAVVRQGARSGVAAAAKRAAAAGAVLAVKKVPKKPTLLGKLVRGAAQIVKDINPLEALGDAWAENRKYDSFEAIARRYSIDIASRVLDEFSGPYEREVLLPLRNRSAEIEHGLENRRAQRQEKAEEFQEECRAMQAVAEQLSLFAESLD